MRALTLGLLITFSNITFANTVDYQILKSALKEQKCDISEYRKNDDIGFSSIKSQSAIVLCGQNIYASLGDDEYGNNIAFLTIKDSESFDDLYKFTYLCTIDSRSLSEREKCNRDSQAIINLIFSHIE